MSHKYNMLIRALDRLRAEAPESFKSYNPDDSETEKIGKARSIAFIHLLLAVRFGLTDFLERHQHITDGSQDGGMDAYYIDDDRKKIYLIQSKFRNSANKFDNKKMGADDLIKMEVSRIIKGEESDSRGIQFNAKIHDFQRRMYERRDIAKYDHIVCFLGNVYNYTDEQVRRAIDNSLYETYDAEKAYSELLFPLATGTYYNPDEIIIYIGLSEKEHPRLKQSIETEYGRYNVTAIFVPTLEVGRIMSKYKNAILKYNPRNFLSLQKKSVNENIRKSVVEKEKNNFAILNNGLTLMSDNIDISESTGKKNEGQLILTRPQIINGGQTAYTLSQIYEESLGTENNPLSNKEVLFRIITPISSDDSVTTEFIQMISNATNQQNEVSEADRRSNHSVQIILQNNIFDEFGYFYERKSGEFYDGIKQGLIDPSLVINRLTFIKSFMAFLGQPAAARRTSEKVLFREDMFYKILGDVNRYREMLLAYLMFHYMEKLEASYSKKTDSIKKNGYALLYGKWAVIASVGVMNPTIPSDPDIFYESAKEFVEERLNRWKEFDEFIRSKHLDTKYFKSGRSNFELFYKVNLLDDDIREYFIL